MGLILITETKLKIALVSTDILGVLSWVSYFDIIFLIFEWDHVYILTFSVFPSLETQKIFSVHPLLGMPHTCLHVAISATMLRSTILMLLLFSRPVSVFFYLFLFCWLCIRLLFIHTLHAVSELYYPTCIWHDSVALVSYTHPEIVLIHSSCRWAASRSSISRTSWLSELWRPSPAQEFPFTR